MAVTESSPFQPRTLQREEATNDLQRYAQHMQRQNSESIEAVKRRRQEPITSLDPVASGALPPPDENEASRAPLTERLKAPKISVDSTFTLTPEEYARRMAEAALTRNGRALKGKTTTKVDRRNYASYSSAYTRPAAEVLREMLEVRYKKTRREAEDEAAAAAGLLADGTGRVEGRVRRALGLR